MRGKIIIFLVGALLGFLPMYLENQRVRQEFQEAELDLTARAGESESKLAETEAQLRLAKLHNRLGALVMEATQGNFGTARGHSTRFFDDLREAADSADDPTTREALRQILSQRDGITAALVSADRAVVSRLMSLYQAFPGMSQPEPPRTQPATTPPTPPDAER